MSNTRQSPRLEFLQRLDRIAPKNPYDEMDKPNSFRTWEACKQAWFELIGKDGSSMEGEFNWTATVHGIHGPQSVSKGEGGQRASFITFDYVTLPKVEHMSGSPRHRGIFPEEFSKTVNFIPDQVREMQRMQMGSDLVDKRLQEQLGAVASSAWAEGSNDGEKQAPPKGTVWAAIVAEQQKKAEKLELKNAELEQNLNAAIRKADVWEERARGQEKLYLKSVDNEKALAAQVQVMHHRVLVLEAENHKYEAWINKVYAMCKELPDAR